MNRGAKGLLATALASLPTHVGAAASLGTPPQETPDAQSPGDASGEVTSAEVVPAPPEPDTTNWSFAFTPYLWAASTHAKIKTPQGETIRVRQSFRDLLSDLKFAAMGTFEARRHRFVVVSDLIYLHLGAGASGQLGPIPLKSDVDLKLLSSTNMVGYRVVDKGPMFLDLLAGVRFTRQQLDIGLTIANLEFGRDFNKTSVGPVFASRFRAPLSGRWGAALYGDIGGFGVSSNFSWQLMGTVQYDLSSHWRLAAGWRHFSVHDERRGFDVHLGFDGPVVGVTYRF